MIHSTITGFQGKEIKSYHCLVTGETILGANLFKDIFASIRDNDILHCYVSDGGHR